MKKNYTVTLEEDTWRRLEEMAQEQDTTYRGRLSRSAVIGQLVDAGFVVGPDRTGEAAVRVTASGIAIDNSGRANLPPYRLADIVAQWPEKTQAQWRAEEWKAGRWVKLVLDTINGQG